LLADAAFLCYLQQSCGSQAREEQNHLITFASLVLQNETKFFPKLLISFAVFEYYDEYY
jgi:hypothetical protein